MMDIQCAIIYLPVSILMYNKEYSMAQQAQQ